MVRLWGAMYALVWVSLVQILVILFPVLPLVPQTVDAHALIGIVVLALAFYTFRRVRKTSCPARIKRITMATSFMALLQLILGLLLYSSVVFSFFSGTLFRLYSSFT